MTKHNSYYPILKTLSVLLLLVVMISCENNITVVNSLTVDETTPIESSFDVDMDYTDSGRLVMIMHTPEANRYPTEEEYMEMPKGMNMVFYDSIGNEKSDLSSEYAISFVTKKIMEARINVVATGAEGDKLFTELLIWDQVKKTIYTDAPVRVVKKDGKTLYGDGLVSDETFTDYKITHPRGKFDLGDDEEDESSENIDENKSTENKTSNTKVNSGTENKGNNNSEEEDEFGDFDEY